MLADRPYMRRDSFRAPRSMTVILILINVAVFLLENLLYISGHRPGVSRFVREYLALSPEGLLGGYVWQLLTFQFLHGGLLHLLLNCLALYFFGKAVEHAMGRRTFTKLYFLSGFLGGLLQVIVWVVTNWIDPKQGYGTVVGASAGVFGIVAAYALMFPENQITLLLFFVIPVTLRAKYLLWAGVALSVFGILRPYGNVAHAAHLGGIAAAWGYLRWGSYLEGLWISRRVRRPQVRPRELVRMRSPRGNAWPPAKTGDLNDLPSDEFISRQVDPILEKISAHGIHSLTPEERRILEQARARMEKRGGRGSAGPLL